MTGITTYLSILTLNVKDLTPLSKDTIWQIGLKRKIQQSAAYIRPISLTEKKHWLRVKGWRKKIYQANGPPKTGRGSHTYLGQNSLQTYIDQMG
jgi:hypothetical protein